MPIIFLAWEAIAICSIVIELWLAGVLNNNNNDDNNNNFSSNSLSTSKSKEENKQLLFDGFEWCKRPL